MLSLNAAVEAEKAEYGEGFASVSGRNKSCPTQSPFLVRSIRGVVSGMEDMSNRVCATYQNFTNKMATTYL
ncbi:MAG: hypothetical protein ACLUKN_03230 [Bacilli bacterium]